MVDYWLYYHTDCGLAFIQKKLDAGNLIVLLFAVPKFLVYIGNMEIVSESIFEVLGI